MVRTRRLGQDQQMDRMRALRRRLAPPVALGRGLAGRPAALPRADLVSAVVVSALMVPQALGYAAVARVPIQAGLYAIPAALIVYAFLGSSPQLIVGPVSTVSVLTGSLLAARGALTPSEAIGVAAALAIISGLVLVVAGLARIGWVAEFLSKPIITGFVFGLTIVIIIGELPVVLGLDRPSGTVIERLEALVRSADELHGPTAAIGVLALAVLFGGNRVHRSIPWGLIIVVAGLVASPAFDLPGRGVAEVGAVPLGLPRPSLPDITGAEFVALFVSGAGLALVGLAESLSAARLFAVRNGYRVDADQEFIATGAANIAAGFSGGIGVAGSLSKTATVDSTGGKSQVTGLVSAVIVVVSLVSLASSLEALPRAILSAIVIQAVWGLMDHEAIRRYRQVRRNDFNSAIAALVGVLLLGTLTGLVIAIGLSVIGLVYRSGRVEVDVLGRVKGEKAAWGSLRRHPDAPTKDNILILRLSAPLFWVNAASASALILDKVERAPETRAVILDLEATSQLDVTSVDELMSLIRRLRSAGVDVYLVRLMYRARKVLRAAGVIDEIGRDHMWRTISQGVRAAKEARKGEDG